MNKLRENAEDFDDMAPDPRWLQLRMGLMVLGLIGLFAVVLSHMYQLQVAGGEHLEEKADEQVAASVTLESHRGSILDRQGKEMAVSIEVPSIYVHPRQIKGEEAKLKTAQLLAQALDLPLDVVLKKVKKDRSFVWIFRKATPSQGDAVRALKLKGVGVERETKRFFPNQALAGQLLGFVGVDNKGLAGLELALDEELRGGSVKIKTVRDARGKMLMTLEPPKLHALEGDSVVLTIDQHIQHVAEVAIERVSREFKAKAGMALVMNPHTGEILAMASWPRFDPNQFRNYTSRDWRNRILTDSFEPGSIFKPFLYAAALDAGVVKPDTPLDIGDGSYEIGADTISDTHLVDDMTAERSVVHSSNVASYLMARSLGRRPFYEVLRGLGFGTKTGLGLPGEAVGIVQRPAERWPEITLANIAFGQGISATPIQIGAALCALGNGGTLMKPMLFREIRDRDGGVKETFEPQVVRRVYSEKAVRQTREALHKVVTEGTGLRAWVDHYPVGGKTGTPQKVDPVRGGYANRWMANFMGLAPIDDPQIAVLIMVDEPKSSHLGGRVAAPAFSEIVGLTLPYLGVYPAEVYNGTALKVPTVVITPEADAPESAVDGVPVVGAAPVGMSAVNAALGGEEEALEQHAPVVAGESQVPDFNGMSLREAVGAARESGLSVEPRRTGYVIEQWPAPGTMVASDTPIQITLARRYRQTYIGFEER